MILKSPDPATRIVEEYKFSFNGGQVLPITIDRAAGDTVSFEQAPIAIVIKLAEKPSPINPDVMFMEEEVTIFYRHLIAIEKIKKEVTDLTFEQKEQWRELIKTCSTPTSILKH